MPTDKQYAQRDIVQLDEDGDYYIRHVSAMTAEGLHAKSDIAAELAWRDREIARLREALRMAADELDSYYCAEYPCADSYPSQARKLALAMQSNPARAAMENGDDGAD